MTQCFKANKVGLNILATSIYFYGSMEGDYAVKALPVMPTGDDLLESGLVVPCPEHIDCYKACNEDVLPDVIRSAVESYTAKYFPEG